LRTRSTTTGEKVAIKKCGSLFKYPEDGKRILREIKLMQATRGLVGLLSRTTGAAASIVKIFREICSVCRISRGRYSSFIEKIGGRN